MHIFVKIVAKIKSLFFILIIIINIECVRYALKIAIQLKNLFRKIKFGLAIHQLLANNGLK